MANQILAGAVFQAGQVIAGVDAFSSYVSPPTQLIVGSNQVDKVFSFSTDDFSVLHEITNPYGDGNWGVDTDVIGRKLFIRGNIGHETNPNGESYVAYDVDNLSSPPTIPSGGYKVYSNLATTNDKVFAIVSPDGSSSGRELAELDPTTLEKINSISTPSNTTNGFLGGPVFAHDGKVYKGDTDYHGSQTGTSNGKMYIFDASSGNLLHTISAPSPSSNYSDIDRWGSNVSVNDSWLAITGYTSKIHVGNTLVSRGSVHVYDQNDLSASPVELFASNDQILLGSDLEIRGDLVFAGSRGEDGSDGRVHVFDMSTGGTLIHSLEVSDQFTSDGPNLGYFITSTSTHLFVSAPNAKSSSTSGLVGAIHKFDLSDLSAAPVSIYGSELYEFYLQGPMTHLTIAQSPPPVPTFIAPPVPPSLLVVSGPYAPGNENTVFVYDLDNMSEGATGLMPFDNEHPDPWTQAFGSALTVTDKYIVVGSTDDNDNNPYSGSVYVYDKTDISAQPTKLLAFDGDEYAVFGHQLDYSDGYIFVGARGDDNEFGNGAGAVYVYDENDLSAQPIKLIENSSQFGVRLSAVNGKLAVSSASGVFVYDINDLTASPTQVGSTYTGEVLLSGSRLFVGDAADNNGAGEVKVYDINDLTASPTQITAPDGSSGDYFGSDLALNSTNLYIGAHYDDDNGTNSGSFYVYNLADLSAQPTKITAPDGSSGDFFSRDIVVDDNYVVVGAYGFDSGNSTVSAWDGTGAIYVYDAKDLSATPVKVVETTGHNDRFGLYMAIGKGATAALPTFIAPPPPASPYSQAAEGTWVVAVTAQFADSYNGQAFIMREGGNNITLSTPATGNLVGSAISIGSDYVFVGNLHYDAYGDNAGAVFVFDKVTGSMVNTLQASTMSNNTGFGSADIETKASGNRVAIKLNKRAQIVGSPNEAYGYGHIEIMNHDGTNRVEISHPDFDINQGYANMISFGTSTGWTTNRFVASASGADDGGDSSGSVFIYNPEDGSLVTRIDGTQANEFFGIDIATQPNHTRILVGARGWNNEAGRVTLYEEDGTEVMSIERPTPRATAKFGIKVAYGSGRIVVTENLDTTVGRVFIFNEEDGSLINTVTGPRSDNYATGTIDIAGNYIFVSASGVNNNNGAFWVYDLDGNNGTRIDNIGASGFAHFGTRLSAVVE